MKIDISKVRITKIEQAKVEAALAVLAKLGATPSRRVLHKVKMANRFRLDRGMITRIEDQLTVDGSADVVVNRKRDDIIVYSRETLAQKQEHGKKLGSGAFKKKTVGGLAGMSPEERREAGRKGGLAAAQKRSKKAEMRKKRGPHWTQRPENREKVVELARKAAAARKNKKAAA